MSWDYYKEYVYYWYVVSPKDPKNGEDETYCHYGEPDSEGKPVVMLIDGKGR